VEGFECHPFNNDYRDNQLFSEVLDTISQKHTNMKSVGRHRSTILSQWYGMLEAYTHRDLTKHTDRILAISGIASQIGPVLRDAYAARLWRSNPLNGLLWCIDIGTQRLQLQEYQGPSWSWIWVNSQISYRHHHRNDQIFEVIDCQVESQTKGLNDQETGYSVADSFGAVRMASVILKGRLRPARWNGSAHSSLLRMSFTGLYKTAVTAFVVSDTLEFVPQTVGNAIDVYLLLLGIQPGRLVDTQVVGPVLHQGPNSTYTRIGLLNHDFTHMSHEQNENGDTREETYQLSVDWIQVGTPQNIRII